MRPIIEKGISEVRDSHDMRWKYMPVICKDSEETVVATEKGLMKVGVSAAIRPDAGTMVSPCLK